MSQESVTAPAPDAPAPIDWVTPQLTLRALLTGMLLGGLMSACNIYTGLTIGWGTNMSITSVLLSYAFWMVLQKTFGTRPWTMLENNVNQAAASAAAAVSSAGLVAPIPALTMLTGQTLDWTWLALWVFSVCLVGITVAIPIRRQMIVVDKLPFPSGMATAHTLREIYARGQEAIRRVQVLGGAALFAIYDKLLFEYGIRGFKLALVELPIPVAWLKGFSAKPLTLALDPQVLMFGVGGLIGFRACVSLLIGAILAWGVLAPRLIHGNLARLRVSEPLAALPPGVESGLRPEPEGYAKYKPESWRLEYKGQMSAAERDVLLALSEEPRYREAVEKLYARSQLRLPADAQREAAVRLATTVDALASEPLATWPRELSVPREFGYFLRFDDRRDRLVAVGRLPDACVSEMHRRIEALAQRHPGQRAVLNAVTAAIDRLAVKSREPLLPPGDTVPVALAERLTIDSVARTLRVVGPLGATDVEQTRALRPDDADFTESVGALAASATFRPATANATYFTDALEWLLWPGVTLMVVSSLVAFGLSGRALLRAFTGIGKADDALTARRGGDVPVRWFLTMLLVALVFSVALQMSLFGISWWAATLGVLLSFILAIVATRVAGETNTTPVGAMGKITQLTFGVITPSNPVPNLMTANVTGGAASQCADLMQDLKTGHMIGAAPYKQAIGQACGALAGALLGSFFYLVMIPNPSEQLMTLEWPAPAVATWKAVAELFMVGIHALPEGALTAMIIAAVLGVILPVLDHTVPRRYKNFVPSAASLGLAFVISATNAISMFLGGLAVLILSKLFPNWSARFVVVICAGLIAGESLTGVGISIQRLFWPF